MATQNDQSANISPLLSETEAAAFVKLSPRTLQKFAQLGGGPVRIKLASKRVAYRRIDLEKWIDTQAQASAA